MSRYAIPKWEDLEIWKKYYAKINEKNITNESQTFKFNSPEELRDLCYKFIDKKESCDTSKGWCKSCIIENGLYGSSYRR